jgi:phosphoribosylformylglycinamidine cyclo-ligase
MAVIVARNHAAQAIALLQANGETVYEIGKIRPQAAGEAPTIVV